MIPKLTFSLDIPTRIRIKLDADKLLNEIGKKIASKARKHIRAGESFDGDPLPAPEGGGAPLNDTGRLLRSLRYSKRTKSIQPSGKHDNGKKNVAILAIQIAKQEIDPLGTTGTQLDEALQQIAQIEIDKMAAKRKIQLLTEIKRWTK